MATITFVPSGAIDGSVWRADVSDTWAEIISGNANYAYNNTANDNGLYIESTATLNKWMAFCRGFFLFRTDLISYDNKFLGTTSTITGGVLRLYSTGKSDTLSITPSLNVYSSSPASDTTLSTADYSQVGSTPFCDTALTYAGWSTTGYNDFTLNAAGLAAINKTGTTKFSVRNANYDVTGNPPAWSSSKHSQFIVSHWGNADPLLLVITYTNIPIVTTQSMSDVVGATATGNGTVVDLGSDNPTQYGHCWATSANPTTTDSKTTLGALTATGAFKSSLTGLTPGTGYYVRAYATNVVGTSYGANVYFKASTDRAGIIWMEGSNLHGFDENAVERTYVHTDDVDDAPVDGALTAPVSSNWAFDHNAAATGVHGAGGYTLLNTGDVADTPVDGDSTIPISSNWAFDHGTDADPHTVYRLESDDHSHETTGAEAGQLDHGLAMEGTSLLDDDHTQYQLESDIPTTATDRTFYVNMFNYPDPISEWKATVYGAYLGSSLTAKVCYLPLNFLKEGDIITDYTLKGDATEVLALTLDCKLVQVNLANPLTTTDITNGGMAQVTADGNFAVAVDCDDVTVTTNKQYLLQITGTTGIGDSIYVMGAEVQITRLI